MNYLDTTVIVAALMVSHPNHKASYKAMSGGFSDAHALAESFRVLTAGYKIASGQAAEILMAVPAKFWRAVDLEDYRRAVRWCADSDLGSGAVYDAVHASVARREKAGKILTHNLSDFQRFSGGLPVESP